VGRGSAVDETSLISSLKDNKIAGAVLDVTHQEPLLSDDELWDCPHLILTQHTGGGSKSELKGKVSIFLENLDLYLQQKPLKRTVR
jgi:phosphoglycerate dehydrogenase-like enzyme